MLKTLSHSYENVVDLKFGKFKNILYICIMKKLINWVKQFFKDVWLGIDIANKNYLDGKSQWGKF